MHPIIQAEVDEFRKKFGEQGTNLDDQAIFLSAALLRAIEKAGKEMVGNERNVKVKGINFDAGYNSHCSLALSKLDTIINFKENEK